MPPPVQGTGNEGYLPKWELTNNSVLIDSNISDIGGVVSVNADITVGSYDAPKTIYLFGSVAALAGIDVSGAPLNVGSLGTGQPLNAYGPVNVGTLGAGQPLNAYGPVNAQKGIAVSGSVYAQNVSSDAVIGVSNSRFGVYGNSNSASGVYGQSSSGPGVYGYSSSGYGVGGQTTSGYGVYGQSSSSDGVYGQSSSGPGVNGQSGSSYGVGGSSSSGSGVVGFSTHSYGVYGYGYNSHGVYGYTFNHGNKPEVYAGYFYGDLRVTGTLKKTAGTFTIDHPLDPENRYLNHSFVESPERKNVYDGIAVCDAHGEAVVELPAWFEPLNRDLRYQLTPIGAPAPNLHVAAEVKRGRFKIAGGAPGLRVSWQLTGVRQDAWAKVNPFVVEEDKAAGDRGFLLHPEAHGLPAERGLHREIEAQARAHLSEVEKMAERARAEAGTIKPQT